MTTPPSGTVTFLFTDIEGSTRLWDAHPTEMSEAQAHHDELLRRVIARGNGYVFSHAGDGVGASFASPQAAIEAALEVQHGLASHRWPEAVGALRVRMGMHTGTAEERDGDYFGTSVNRAARVASVANGGQVLVTDAVRLLVEDLGIADLGFRDLGERTLRDLARPERLWLVNHPDLPDAPEPVHTHTTRGNIGPQRSPIFGRDAELARVEDLVGRNRLVSIVGVGGVGKTKLAREAARRAAHGYPAGAWFVDLAAVSDPQAVPASIATTIGVTERPGMTVTGSLVDALAAGRRLLVFDNAEHVIDATADLVDLILTSPTDCDLVVTSREALGVDGEVVEHLQPLDPAHGAARELFRARARRVAPDLPLDDEVAIESICRLVDGLPLGIELAAGLCDTLGLGEILTGLEQRTLELTTHGGRGDRRHSSVDQAIRWSYGLLDERQQRVFERLAVFPGGATLDAVTGVCADEAIRSSVIPSVLRDLVRKSMVVTRRGESTRFVLLETLRAFALERLEERGEHAPLAERHARWFAAMSQESEAGMNSPDEARHVRRVLDELDNLRTAVAWATAQPDADVLADLGASLLRLMSGKLRPELATWAEAALECLPTDHPGRINFASIVAMGEIFSGRITTARDRIREDLAGLPHTPEVKVALVQTDLISSFFSGDLDRVIAESPAQFDRIRSGVIPEAFSIGADYVLALAYRGRIDEAVQVAEQMQEYATAYGVPSMLAWTAYAWGELEADTDPASAIEWYEEAIDQGISVHNEFIAGISLTALAAAAGRGGDPKVALNATERCIGHWRSEGNRPQLWTAIRNLVELLHRLGMDHEALTLHAATEANLDEAPGLFGPHGERYLAIVEEIQNAVTSQEPLEHGAGLRQGTAASFAVETIHRALAGIG